MTIDESTRRSLYDSLVASLGGNQADTLMSLLPQYPLAELATRDDMHSLAIALRGEMALGFGKVDRQFGEVRGEVAGLRGEMVELRGELRSEVAGLRGEMVELRGELRSEMTELRGELRGEMALGFAKVDRQFGEMRGDIAELRGEIGTLSGDLRAEFSQQVLMLGLLLGASLLAMLGTVLTLGFTGAFA